MDNINNPFTTSEITSLTIGQLDVRSKVRFTNYKTRNPGGGVRSEIRELSRQSRSRLIYKARNMPGLNSFLTLTYPHADHAENATGGNFMTDGLAVKEHLRKIRQVLNYRGLSGLWFLEFQKRGAPHFHFFLAGEIEPGVLEKLKKTWYKMVGSTCEHHQERGVDYQVLRKKHAAGAYAAKYSSKSEQKTVPDRYKSVGRFWGTFGQINTKKAVISLPNIKEVYKAIRVARNAARAHQRSLGYRTRKVRHDLHSGGGTIYNAAPALLTYLKYLYISSENPAEIVVLAPVSHIPASGPP